MKNRSDHHRSFAWLLMLGAVMLVLLAGCRPLVAPAAPQVAPTGTKPGGAAGDAATAPLPSLIPPTDSRPATAPPTPAASRTVEVAVAVTEPSPTVVVAAAPTVAPTSTAVPPTVAADLAMPESAPETAGPPVRMAIRGLEIDAPVVPMGWEVIETAKGPVSQWQIPEDEAGHHINSASLGEHGNLVISGHNNIYGRVFERISRAWKDDDRVKVDQFTDRSDALNGQSVELYGAEGERFDYRIEEFYRLRDTGVSQAQRIQNARFIEPTEDDRLTIVTCWPPWNNTHRLVLVARPVSQP